MTLCSSPPAGFSRRSILGGAAGAIVLGNTRLAFASRAGSGPKLVILNVIGGLDGLATVIPYGDPNLSGLRKGLLPKTIFQIDNFFGLDPHFTNLARMFQAGQALAVHCVGPISDTRSHFLGQDLLQGGCSSLMTDGWLNRALPYVQYGGPLQAGLALGTSAPLAISGAAPTAGWTSDPFPPTPPLMQSVIQTAASTDSDISGAYAIAYQDMATFNQIVNGHLNQSDSALCRLAKVAGLCLASPNGPQVAIIETESVDTHSDQLDRQGTLFQDIDNAFAALKSSFGSAWASTIVMTMTEFGRTAYENGTAGTDHGTGFAVLVAGGAVVNGGRVVVNNGWPGLSQAQLYQGRDLAPTADFRQVAMSILSDHMGLTSSALQTVFPNNGGLTPLTGLVQ